MKKIKSKLLFIILMLFLGVVFINTNVKAASASLSASNMNPEEGQTVTVTGVVTAGAWNLKLSGAGKSETIYGFTQANANASDSKNISFVAGSAGTKYTFTLTGDMTDITAGQSDPSEKVNKSITVTVKEKTQSNQGGQSSTNTPNTSTPPTNTEKPKTPEKSKVAILSNLGIKPNDFSGFKSNKYSYDVEVPNDVEKIEVYANKGQSAQKITGTGTKTLQEGKNTFNVVVTAEAGNTQTYTINVTRKQEQEETPVEEEPDENKEETPEEEPTDKTFGLTSLKIEGLEIKPEFQTDVYEYKLELKENIDKLDITTLASEANSNIEITGNENLVEGENVITIIVKSENEEKTITYQLTVNKVIKIEQEESFMENKKIIILSVAGIVILVIVIGIVIAKLRKEKSYDSEYIPYNGLNNDYNETNEDVFESQEEQTYEEDINDDEYRKNKRSKGKRFK